MSDTKKLRRVVAEVAALAETDPETAKTLRDKIRPDLEYAAEQLEHRAKLAVFAAGGADPEEALDPLCRVVDELPEQLAKLERKYKRAARLVPANRRAIWKQIRDQVG